MKFNPGDRVAERPKASHFNFLDPKTEERIAQYRTQRYGTVVDSFIKVTVDRTKNKKESKYVRVIWDGQQSPTEHAQCRLVFESELPETLASYTSSIGT